MAYEVLFLSQEDVKSLGITMKEVIEQVELGLKLKGEGFVEMPAKPGVHPKENCYIHAMPCWVGGDVDSAGIKWVAGFPENIKIGLPYNNGVFIMNDTNTGVPKAFMDANWITTWRTGAASGVGAKYFANPKSEVVAVVGLGTIGRISLQAFEAVMPNLKAVKIYDPINTQKQAYEDTMKAIFPKLEFIHCDSLPSVCGDADVVTTCAPILEQPLRPLTPDMLKKDALCISTDYDSTLSASVVSDGSCFVCDDRNQYLWTQALGTYFQNGYPLEAGIYADMGEICAHKKEPVMSGRRACVFMGIACHDVMTARLIHKKATEKKAGTMLSL